MSFTPTSPTHQTFLQRLPPFDGCQAMSPKSPTFSPQSMSAASMHATLLTPDAWFYRVFWDPWREDVNGRVGNLFLKTESRSDGPFWISNTN